MNRENLKILQGKPIARMMLVVGRTMIVKLQRSLMSGFIHQKRLFLTYTMNCSCCVRNQRKKVRLNRRKPMMPTPRAVSRQRVMGRR